MSRGLGRIEHTILKLLKRRGVITAFTVADVAHPRSGWTRGGHVSALRAMRLIASKYPHRYVLAGGKGTACLSLYDRRYYDKFLPQARP